MVAGKHDFIIEKGSTWNPTLTIKNDDNSVFDLTSYQARMDIRSSQAASSTILSLTQLSGITITASTGQMAISVAASATSAISADSGVYDLEIEDGSGVVTRLMEGNVIIKDEVTR